MSASAAISKADDMPTPAMRFPTPKDGVLKNRYTAIDLDGRSVLELDDASFKKEVADKLWKHGIVCVKGQDLTPSELKELTARLGEPTLLPSCFAFDNRDPGHPEVVRVGNIKVDGSVVPRVTAAEYWHHDGNFWGMPGYRLVNLLHAKVIPPVGGNTGFMDTTMALHSDMFSAEEKQRLRDSTCLVSCKWISDFKNAKPEELLPDVTLPCVYPHPITGQETLYCPFTPKGLFDQKRKEHWKPNEDLWADMCENGYTYEHQWEQGDILMWDNLQVCHRSMGGYGNHPRLLFRTQARYGQPSKGKM